MHQALNNHDGGKQNTLTSAVASVSKLLELGLGFGLCTEELLWARWLLLHLISDRIDRLRKA